MTPTAARNMACALALDQPDQALAIARSIEKPWFRCQALSHVGRNWKDSDYYEILREAVRACDQDENVYDRVTVSAWPIRAYLERENLFEARNLLQIYTSAAAEIENMGGRSEALFNLFQAAKPYQLDLWQPVFEALVRAAEPRLAWRQLRNLRNATTMVAKSNPEVANDVLKMLFDEKNRAAVQRDLERLNERLAEPRSFF